MTIFEKVAYWIFVFIIGGLIIYFIPNRHRIEYPTYQPKSQTHHEKLYAEGWKWCEGKGIYVRGNKVYPALYGAYFRARHTVDIGLNNGTTFLEVKDPNTGESIKLKYGENILYPTLIWDNGQSINSFSVGDFSVNEDWDKSAWKDWNLPEEGNIALYGDREYHAILRHGPYDFPEADPNDYAKLYGMGPMFSYMTNIPFCAEEEYDICMKDPNMLNNPQGLQIKAGMSCKPIL